MLHKFQRLQSKFLQTCKEYDIFEVPLKKLKNFVKANQRSANQVYLSLILI